MTSDLADLIPILDRLFPGRRVRSYGGSEEPSGATVITIRLEPRETKHDA